MDLSRNNMKKIRGLIVFTAVVCLDVIKFDVVLKCILFEFGILKTIINFAV